MEEKILEVMVSKFTEELISQGKQLFNGFYDEAKQFVDKNVKTYLVHQQNRFSHFKTLLHGNTPIYLYDIYFPMKLIADNGIITTENLTNIFSLSNNITIVGDAGSGKSTLIRHLFLTTIKDNFGIPLIVEFRYLNLFKGSFKDYIKNQINQYGISENDDILERFLKKGKFVFFLDGFDELQSKIQPKIINELTTFIDQYSKNKYLISVRPYSNIEYHSSFINYRLCDLTKEEVYSFISLQLKKEPELSQRIIDSIKEKEDDNKYKYIQSFLSNPLLLTLYILTFQLNPTIPERKFLFYRRVVDALFIEHDSKAKLGFNREFQSNLSKYEFEEILKRFCFLSFFDFKYNFDNEYIVQILTKVRSKYQEVDFNIDLFIRDLKIAVCLWIEDGGMISFAHRSLQEFYASLYISSLNTSNKETLYKKLVKIITNSKLSEIENLLSLCKEMDTVNYLANFELPLLNELYNYINHGEKRIRLSRFFSLFFMSMTIKTSADWKIKIESNEATNKFSFITRSKQGSIFIKIQRCFKNEYKNAYQNKYVIESDFYQIDLRNGLTTQSVEFFEYIGMTGLARNFANEIRDLIESNKNYISSVAGSDKDIVNMI